MDISGLILGGWFTVESLNVIDRIFKGEEVQASMMRKVVDPLLVWVGYEMLTSKSQNVSVPTRPGQRQQLQAGLKSLEEAAEALKKPAIPVDGFRAKWEKIIPNPSVVLILGKRGSGKSALGYYLLETLSSRGSVYVVGFPRQQANLLPPSYSIVSRLEDAPRGAIVLVDEAYTFYQSRESQTERARGLLAILGMSRKKQQTLIFVAHESRQLDINVLSHVDVLVMKQPSLFQRGLDRPVIRDIVDKAKRVFNSVEGDCRRFAYVISDQAEFEGVLENNTASFWNEALSRVFVESVEAEADIAEKPAQKMNRGDKRREAKRLKKLGHSFSEISKILSVSRASVWNYVHEK